MIQNNDLKSFNVFASETAGYYDETYKDNPQYAAGHEPLQSLPATWYNTLMRDLTQQAQTTKNVVDSIYAELKNVIVEGGQTLSSADTQQLLKAINKITELQIATGTVLGGIYSSADKWFVSVQPDGTAKVNTVDSSTSTKGLVKLNDTLTSTSTSEALTAKQGKALKDAADTLSTTVSNLSTNLSTNYKPKQTAVSNPTANGTTITAIDTISQDANGVISATKKTIRSASTTQTGVVQLSNSYVGTSQTTAVTEKALKDGLATKQVSGAYKTEQVAIASTPLSTDAVTDAFIDTLGQNSNGVILATKRKVMSASVDQKGIVQLSNSYSGTSQTLAVTEKALSDGLATKQAAGNYKTVQTAVTDPTANGTTITAIDTISQDANGVISATKKTIRSASTTQTGVVKLNDTLTSTSTSEALTAKQGKALKDAADTLSTTVSDLSTDLSTNYKPKQTAVTDPTADGTTITAIDTISQSTNGVISATKKTIRSASTTQTGVVKLNDTLTSTSTSEALTAKQGKALKDAADTLSTTVSDLSTDLSTLSTTVSDLSTDLSTNYKPKQTAVSDPTADGTTITAIDTIRQDTNGEISATKKTIRSASTTQTGVVQLSNSYTGDSQTTAVTEKALSDGLKAAGHTYTRLAIPYLADASYLQHIFTKGSADEYKLKISINPNIKVIEAEVGIQASAYAAAVDSDSGFVSFILGSSIAANYPSILISESSARGLSHTVSVYADGSLSEDNRLIQTILLYISSKVNSTPFAYGTMVRIYVSLLVEDKPEDVSSLSDIITYSQDSSMYPSGVVAYASGSAIDIYAKSLTLI